MMQQSFKNLSKQEQLILITGVVSVIVLAVESKKLKTSEMLVSSAIMLALIYLQMYNMNCLLKGNCNTWAWVVSVTLAVSYISVAMKSDIMSMFGM